MAKKAKPSVDKIVKKVNKEFDKTSSQIEKLINDALKQFDSLQNQIQEPVRKLLKEVDELRDREMKRFNEEFERRLNEFHELQNSILERLGIASKELKDEVKKTADTASTKVSAAKPKAATTKPAPKSTAKKAPAKTAAKAKTTAKPKTTAKKAPAKKAAKPVNKNDLTRVKGIGPATAKKMQEAGINSIEQIATPSDTDKEKLQAFSKMKGFATLSDEAKKIL
ncbi:MAG: helix-hairpin-helix domain-containing protein [Marinobacter sp.]|nr:helix-hairpin-helix domain-containing protein [Marinobacter sp.]